MTDAERQKLADTITRGGLWKELDDLRARQDRAAAEYYSPKAPQAEDYALRHPGFPSNVVYNPSRPANGSPTLTPSTRPPTTDPTLWAGSTGRNDTLGISTWLPSPQNQYGFSPDSPWKDIDSTERDPLAASWLADFRNKHGRDPGPEDIALRLFSIAYPDEYDESEFYDEDGNYIVGSMNQAFDLKSAGRRSWTNAPDAIERLARAYSPGNEEKFTRDIGTLFGGLKNRLEEPDARAAISYEHNPARDWVYISKGNLPDYLIGVDKDSNIHHWAWGVALGGEYGPGGSIVNTGRELYQLGGDVLGQHANVGNTLADIKLGNLGAIFGTDVRLAGLNPHRLRKIWNTSMLNEW